jgi:uroporphyrinogen-III decarboxylase
MIETGADIIDIDHAVTEMARFAPLLSANQVFSGNSDPVSVIQNGSPQTISESVHKACRAAGGRCIVSAGCEITPDTSSGNMRVLGDCARSACEV